ncbi:hypothetical protein D9M71_710150 [compost metagenome]
MQRTGGHKDLPVALLDRHDSSGAHLVDHQFQEQLRIGNSLHAAGRRRQVTGLCVMNKHQAIRTAHGPQRTPQTASPTLAHYRFPSVNGLYLLYSTCNSTAGKRLPQKHQKPVTVPAQYSAPAAHH